MHTHTHTHIHTHTHAQGFLFDSSGLHESLTWLLESEGSVPARTVTVLLTGGPCHAMILMFSHYHVWKCTCQCHRARVAHKHIRSHAGAKTGKSWSLLGCAREPSEGLEVLIEGACNLSFVQPFSPSLSISLFCSLSHFLSLFLARTFTLSYRLEQWR
jgi:hypothetical protein